MIGNIWLTGEEKSKALSSDAGIAVGERQGDLPTATTAAEAVPYRGTMCAFGEEFLPKSEKNEDPAPPARLLMARLRKEREAKAAAQTEVPTPPSSPQGGRDVWNRKDHQLFYKYGHLPTLVSFPDEDYENEYPGEYIKPDLKNTHFPGIDSLKKGGLFKITHKSRAYLRPPGCYLSGKCKVNFGHYYIDEVFGVGTEFEIDHASGRICFQ